MTPSPFQSSAAPGDRLAGERSANARGPINKHTSMADRLAAGTAIDPETGCHNWTKTLTTSGYGQVSTGRSAPRKQFAHRASYELHKGPIPAGMHIDHLCRNPRCINPEHLEAVTPRENTLRGYAPNAVACRNNACLRGHAYVEGSHYVHPKTGARHCRICHPHRKGQPRLRLTPELEAEALRRRVNGQTIVSIAAAMGLHRDTVRKLLVQAGFRAPRLNNPSLRSLT